MTERIRSGHEQDFAGRGWVDWARAHRTALEAVAALPAAAALFLLYHHLAATVQLNSDLALKPLQAYDMLHGDPTLRGWVDASDNYFFTAIPAYVIAVAVHGLSPTVVNVVSAAYYTLTTLAVVALAGAGLSRRDRPLAMLIAFGLVAAPSVSSAGWVLTPPQGAAVLIAGPEHTATALFLLGALLCLRLSHRRARIPLTLLALALLALDVASDPMALYVGVLPLALVHGLRLAGRLPEGILDDGPDLGVAVLGGVIGLVIARVLYPAMGYQNYAVPAIFAQLAQIPSLIWGDIYDWLMLFGAQFGGQPFTIHTTGEEIFRLLGYVFTIAACVTAGILSIQALRRRRRIEAADPLVLSQILLAVVGCDLAEVTFNVLGAGAYNGRYLAPAVFAGAALAGRMAPTMLTRVRWRAVAAAVAICYVALLPLSLRHAARPLPFSSITTWLAANHLDHGLSGYWAAANMTVTSGDTVQVRPVIVNARGRVVPQDWLSRSAWYGRRSYANFLVIDATPDMPTEAAAVATFGAPNSVTDVDGFTVLVWGHNLMPQAREAAAQGPCQGPVCGER